MEEVCHEHFFPANFGDGGSVQDGAGGVVNHHVFPFLEPHLHCVGFHLVAHVEKSYSAARNRGGVHVPRFRCLNGHDCHQAQSVIGTPFPRFQRFFISFVEVGVIDATLLQHRSEVFGKGRYLYGVNPVLGNHKAFGPHHVFAVPAGRSDYEPVPFLHVIPVTDLADPINPLLTDVAAAYQGMPGKFPCIVLQFQD